MENFKPRTSIVLGIALLLHQAADTVQYIQRMQFLYHPSEGLSDSLKLDLWVEPTVKGTYTQVAATLITAPSGLSVVVGDGDALRLSSQYSIRHSSCGRQ